MKEFRSIFKQDFADYIETNQGTISNDTLRNTRSVLLTFDSLLAKENTGEISEAIVNQWIKRLHQVNAPKTVSDKVSYLRKFLRYLQYKGYVVFMPDCPKTSDSYMPYVFRRKKYRYFYPVPTNGVTGIKTQNPTGGYGVLYVAEDAPWVRIPFRRATDCQGKGCQFFQRNHTDPPCQK